MLRFRPLSRLTLLAVLAPTGSAEESGSEHVEPCLRRGFFPSTTGLLVLGKGRASWRSSLWGTGVAGWTRSKGGVPGRDSSRLVFEDGFGSFSILRLKLFSSLISWAVTSGCSTSIWRLLEESIFSVTTSLSSSDRVSLTASLIMTLTCLSFVGGSETLLAPSVP